MGFDMALIPYFHWEQLKDDDAKREFLLENLPQQVLKTSENWKQEMTVAEIGWSEMSSAMTLN